MSVSRMALLSILSQPLAQPSKNSARRKCTHPSEPAITALAPAPWAWYPLKLSLIAFKVPTDHSQSPPTLEQKKIIVVDGGSTDQTASLACAPNVLVLEAFPRAKHPNAR